ncbi:MAG: carbohydrate ABC transporter permease [Clostridiaceae bacterium]|nr:carbohydrate ABC transporter permease [Clostridiaceae bacterium]MDY5015881.1 carbohydrate ABC transporter permease [Eubacteriales bacterium]
MTKPKNRIRTPLEDRVLYAVNTVLLSLFCVIIALPLWYIIVSSFSSGQAILQQRVFLWPVEPTLNGYKAVFSHKYILTSYRNTIFYTVVGTAINIALTLACAYPLSRKDFPFRRFFMVLMTVTMFFGGGLVPSYIVNVNLGLIDNIWVMLIPGAMSVYYMILVRTFMISSVPYELFEAASIDGCSDGYYFFKVLLPLLKPIIAVVTMYYAVGHWNEYFTAMIYLSDQSLFPLQLILRDILVSSKVSLSEIKDAQLLASMIGLEALLKYSLIIVATVPILLTYPFAQKYFVKGVMVGSLKG